MNLRVLCGVLAALSLTVASAGSPTTAAATPDTGPSDQAVFDDAMLAFGHGQKAHRSNRSDAPAQFARAAMLLESLVRERGVRSGRVLHNLGCAHLMTEDWGRAVLALRRAERAMPWSGAVRTNLGVARKRAAVPANPWEALAAEERAARAAALYVGAVPAPWRLGVLLAFNVLTWGSIAARVLGASRPSTLAIATSAAVTIIAAAAFVLPREWDRHFVECVVVSPEVVTRAGPADTLHGAGEAGVLRAGSELRIIDRRTSEWVKVRTAAGAEAWLHATDVEVIALD